MKKTTPDINPDSQNITELQAMVKAYDGLTQVTNVGCFAHARRKFMEAKKLQGKGKTGKVDIALAKTEPDIDQLLPWNFSH